MAFPQGINFRATTGYVTDGATEYCQIPPGTGGNYPTTTPQGNSVGWEGTAFNQVDARDRSTTVDHRLAGMNFTTGSTVAKFRIDLPASGQYNIRIAVGDMSFSTNAQVEVFDDTTSLGVIASGSVAAGQFKDATNATYSAANWPSSNTAVTKTFSSTICRIAIGTTAGNQRSISHIYIEAVTASGTTVAPSGASLALTTGTPTINQPRTLAPSGASLALSTSAPTVSQAVTLAPSGASLTITGFAPTVAQAAPQTIAPAGAVLTLIGYAPTVSQYAASAPAGDGGGAGSVREVRAFAAQLDKAHKLTRSQKKKRRAELVEEVRELLPALPEAEQIAPAIAQIVFEQESKARAMYADRPIEAMAPVVVLFDAKAAIAELIERFMADEAMRRQIEAERAEEDEIDAFLLLGS